jgi:hypothetical protein
MESSLSIDQLLERWRSPELHGATTTLEKLCGHPPEELDEIKEKLRAVASMMSFLGLTQEPAATRGVVRLGTASTEQPDANRETVTDLVSGRSPLRGSRYEVIRHLARGGLGEVFVAQDNELGREVALKEIQDRFAGDAGSRLRFVREAEFTGRLEHPGIVPVYSLGRRDDGQPYYATRLIIGRLKEAAESLREAISRLELPVDEASGNPVFRFCGVGDESCQPSFTDSPTFASPHTLRPGAHVFGLFFGRRRRHLKICR